VYTRAVPHPMENKVAALNAYYASMMNSHECCARNHIIQQCDESLRELSGQFTCAKTWISARASMGIPTRSRSSLEKAGGTSSLEARIARIIAQKKEAGATAASGSPVDGHSASCRKKGPSKVETLRSTVHRVADLRDHPGPRSKRMLICSPPRGKRPSLRPGLVAPVEE
jgi:hypothetical protein